jgi:hypothetical protein
MGTGGVVISGVVSGEGIHNSHQRMNVRVEVVSGLARNVPTPVQSVNEKLGVPEEMGLSRQTPPLQVAPVVVDHPQTFHVAGREAVEKHLSCVFWRLVRFQKVKTADDLVRARVDEQTWCHGGVPGRLLPACAPRLVLPFVFPGGAAIPIAPAAESAVPCIRVLSDRDWVTQAALLRVDPSNAHMLREGPLPQLFQGALHPRWHRPVADLFTAQPDKNHGTESQGSWQLWEMSHCACQQQRENQNHKCEHADRNLGENWAMVHERFSILL